ncbi:hypothetical protein JCM10296v2_007163 [Rhodotorula toruloides]
MSSGSSFWSNFLNYSSVTIGNFDAQEASGWAARLANVDSLTTAAAVNRRIEEIYHLLEYCRVLTDKQVRRLKAKIATLQAEYEDLQYAEARKPPVHQHSEDERRPLVHRPTPPPDRAPTPPLKDDKTGSQTSSPESPRSHRKMPRFKKKSQTYSLAKGAVGEGGYRRAKLYFGEEYV